MKKSLLLIIVMVAAFIFGISTVSANIYTSSVTAKKTTTLGDYTITAGKQLPSVGGAMTTGQIPKEYAYFGFGTIKTPSKVNYGGGTAVDSAVSNLWKKYSDNDLTHKQMFTGGTKAVLASSAKDKYWACYPKVGIDAAGNYIDVKGLVTDIKVNTKYQEGKFKVKAIGTKSTDASKYKNLKPIIAFPNGTGGNASLKYRPGVETMGVNYVQVKWTFYKHNPNNPCSGAAISVKGNTTYWDVDYEQGVKIWNNISGYRYNNGNNKLYLNYHTNKKSSSYKNIPYIFSKEKGNVSVTNNNYAVTELFNGTYITRTYNFERTNGKARGGITHSPKAVNAVVTPPPTKSKSDNVGNYTQASGTFNYTIKQFVPAQNNTHFYSKFVITDKLDSVFDMTYTTVGKITVKNKAGTNVTSWFTPSIAGSTITLTAKRETLRDENFYGDEYFVTIPVKVKSNATYSYNWSDYTRDGICQSKNFPRVSNKASTTYTNIGGSQQTLNTNAVDVCVAIAPNPTKEYYAEAGYTNPGLNNAPVKVGQKIKYKITYYNPTSTTQNVTVTDTLSKGLKLILDKADPNKPNPNPYPTSINYNGGINGSEPTTITWNMKSLGPGEKRVVILEAEVTSAAANKVQNSATVQVGNNAKVNLGPLVNPIPSKKYASDKPEYGANHAEVEIGNTIKYRIEVPNVKSDAVTVTVNDHLSKGLEFQGGADVQDGTKELESSTKDKDGTNVTWKIKVASGKTAIISYDAKVVEGNKLTKDKGECKLGVECVKNNANAVYTYDPNKIIPLAELENPVDIKTDAKKTYSAETPAGLNGRAVRKDDTIIYNINFKNTYSTAQTVTIRDTFSAGLNYARETARLCDAPVTDNKCANPIKPIEESIKQNADGSTEIIWIFGTIPSGAIKTVLYEFKVTGETIRVQNEATIQFGSNSPVDLEKLKNPVPKKEYAKDTPSGFNSTAVAKGNKIKYEITYPNVTDNNLTATIKDTLSNGLEYIKGSSKINGTTTEDPTINGQKLTWTKQMSKDEEHRLTYEALVTGETDKVQNHATMIYSDNPDFEAFLNELKNPVPSKNYASSSSVKKVGQVVKKGDKIIYSIKYSNVSKDAQSIVITDFLSHGLDYVKGSAKINGKSVDPNVSKDAFATSLVWSVKAAAGTSYELVYTGKVTGETKKVENNAQIQYGGSDPIKLNSLYNPLKDEPKPVPKKEEKKQQIAKTPSTGSPLVIGVVIIGIALVAGAVLSIMHKYNINVFKK